MPRSAAVATDNFNRTGPDLGSNWEQLNTSSGSVVIYNRGGGIGDVVGGSHAGGIGGGVARWVGAGTFTADQWASLQITEFSAYGAGYGFGVVCRASADTLSQRDFYYAWYGGDLPEPQTKLGKYVDGTDTRLHESTAPTWSIGDRLELEVEGTTLRLCKNGTPLGGSFTLTDTSLSSGQPGLLCSAGDTDVTGDNWEAGNITADAPDLEAESRNRLSAATRVDAHKATSGVMRQWLKRRSGVLIPAWA